MKALYIIWAGIQVAIGYNLVFPLALQVIQAVRRGFRRDVRPGAGSGAEADYAVIVTAYEQTQLLPAVVASLQQMRYSNYLVYIVADNCDISGLHFDDPRVVLLRPEKVIASNTGSHFYAIRNFKRQHERLTIVDSDNLVHPEYLNELNKCFDSGFVAVQGVRAAKNLNTPLACLDAARDIYYHYYDGKLLFEAGSSATLAGSGMAFTTELYRECLEKLDVQGAGFDKVLQYAIVSRKGRIAFTENAIVYDEKTAQSEQLVKQRARWINTWFRYFSFGFKLLGKSIVTLNWNQFLFGFVLLRPPLFIFLLLSIFFAAANLLIAPLASLVWIVGFGLFVAAFFLALARSHTDKRIYASLKGIPKFMFLQLNSLTKSRKANQISVATKHNYQQETEPVIEN